VASVDTLGLTEPVQQDRQYFEYVTYAALAVNALVIVFTLLIAPRVKVAVACLKVASQAVGHMPSLMLFPMLPFALELALVAWFILVSALLYRYVNQPGKTEQHHRSLSVYFQESELGRVCRQQWPARG